jgi:hypothetical protein
MPQVRSITRRLKFSVQEMRFVALAVGAANQILETVEQREWSRVAIYRYYREFGGAGLDGAILSLALLSSRTEKDSAWQGALWVVNQLVGAWFDDHDALVDPPLVLSGEDLMRVFALEPGPLVGDWLEQVREAQAQGVVNNHEEAIAYLRSRLDG